MINLNKAIYSLLSTYSAVTQYVTSGNIQPLILSENTTLPAIVYTRSSDFSGTKDSRNMATSDVNITVLADSYKETIDISEQVNNRLNNFRGQINGINIRDFSLISVNEQYNENVYKQNLIYSVLSI
jgi:hypothetical protein